MVRHLALALVAILAVVGPACDRIERVTLDDAACEVACECAGALLPAALAECVSDCVESIGALPESCLECVSGATCTELTLDACDDICLGQS